MHQMSCFVADAIGFNSAYNLNSFVDGLTQLWKLLPADQKSHKVQEVQTLIRSKSSVCYFPVEVPDSVPLVPQLPEETPSSAPLLILWNHRWEWV